MLTRLLEPAAGPLMKLRGMSAQDIAERLGREAPGHHGIWFHAASLGELAALRPLQAEVETRLPGVGYWVTTTSVTGRSRAREWFSAPASLAPLDLPGPVARAWQARSPSGLVLIETELWPNLLQTAARSGVPAAMANARISDRSWPRYLRLRGALGPVCRTLAAVAARSEVDADRWAVLGVPENRIQVTGNMKHDGLERSAPMKLPWKDDCKVVTAASVHPGEEEIILSAWERLRAREPQVRLIAAPRHWDRAGGWRAAVERRGWRVALRSQAPARDPEVLFLDTVGELTAALAASQAAVQGGTFVSVGGHNLLEAAAAGIGSITGPYTQNVIEDAAALRKASLAWEEQTAEGLADRLHQLLAEPREALEARSVDVINGMQGAAARTFVWLEANGVWPSAGGRATP